MVERIQGKYLSVKICAEVQNAGMIAQVYTELGQDSRVMMKF